MNKKTMFAAIALLGALSAAGEATQSPADDTLSAVRKRMSGLALPFTENAGQWDRQAAYGAPTFAGMIFVTTEGKLVYSLHGKAPDAGWVLTETLLDGEGKPIVALPRGAQRQSQSVSYLRGADSSEHRDGVATYERVNLGDVYPGIAAQVRATGNNVEKIFTVSPGRDPAQIRIRLDGAERVELGAQGELVAHTGNGPVRYTAPIAYQEDVGGARSAVPVRYRLADATGRYGFALGAYDRERPLVIDPLLQTTYLGGAAEDQIKAIAIHPLNGDVYVAGWTLSSPFPGAVPPGAQSTWNEGYDGFVARLSKDLHHIVQSAYVGYAADDYFNALTIHPLTGDIYCAGATTSVLFPFASRGAYSSRAMTPAGNSFFDGIIVRLNADLTAVNARATFLGGNDLDSIGAIAIHPVTGDVYVTGYTSSTNLPGATTATDPARRINQGGNDAFVASFSPDLATHRQSIYVGGAGNDQANALAIHPLTGEVYIAGDTHSGNFPNVAGSEQTQLADPQFSGGLPGDGFVARLPATLRSVGQAIYLGSAGSDRINALAIHPLTGQVYAAGLTTAASTDFPKALPPVFGGSNDHGAFVTALDALLISRIQSRFVAGNADLIGHALAIHPVTGDIYLAGATLATVMDAIAGADQGTKHGTTGGTSDLWEGFVARLDPAMTVIQTTYVGGSNYDDINSIAIHPTSGEIYVAGVTASSDLSKHNAIDQTAFDQTGYGGGAYDGYVSRLSLELRAGNSIPDPFAFAPSVNVLPGSLQTSGAAFITGIANSVNVPIVINGGLFPQFCISSNACATCDVKTYDDTAIDTIQNARYVCVRQLAPATTPAVAKTTLVVGGTSADYVVTTGNPLGTGCGLDIDGNGTKAAATDGLLLLRAMFGQTGTNVTGGAIGSGAPTRTSWAQIRAFLNGNCGMNFAP